MVKGTARVTNTKGIHARPSAEIALFAKSVKSTIVLNYDGKTSNPINVLQTIVLEMFEGSEIEIVVTGEDEVEVLEKMKMLISKKYDFA
ncbi:MAG: hypothetical protein A2015_08610 [Spirochaetes bacterium GWF1_31_7]|nr:MAG: hypothetical protein A2Y30_07050 [Spirochaetes bacterium GWE1_32_154]OHD47985.1 MAG: hypothetical protein A2015_08610 [Spirochaetes bacterium GWF1_31_7]OHD48076.1 MAG: hypothetical protein A2Y29_07945 [Spirochaetes bacterium GWE2_31_10]OHD81193.1 MAG: hypothetical protein A2355_00300 [Spirochaetes bacterium RIFOXYB1_FULL_32_8]HBD94075.1 hypothetical protein [Spirochaetia bacterium]